MIVNRAAPVSLFHNSCQDLGVSASLYVTQDGPNHFAVGAKLEITAGTRSDNHRISVGGGHAGGAFGPVHFGLAGNDDARMRIIWPDGAVAEDLPVPAGPVSLHRDREGSVTVSPLPVIGD